MAQSKAISSRLAARYAKALIELATDRKVLDKVEQDLQSLKAIVTESGEFSAFLEASFVSAQVRCNVIEAICKKGKFQTETENFLNVINQQGRLTSLEAIIEGVFSLLAAQRGDVNARVESAYTLSASQQKALAKELSGMTGANVILDAHLNKDLIGGMIVTVGSLRIDSSVAGRLGRLKAAMNARQSSNDDTDFTHNQKKEA